MGKLDDVTIRGWIRSGVRFEGRSDGDGLVLTWRPDTKTPSWRFRYRLASKARVMNLGNYSDLPLSAARQAAKELRAKVTLGHDVGRQEAGAQDRGPRANRDGANRHDGREAGRRVLRAHGPRQVEAPEHRAPPHREKNIKPIGKLALEDVEPRHLDAMLQTIVKRGAPTMANDVLRWVRRMFDCNSPTTTVLDGQCSDGLRRW